MRLGTNNAALLMRLEEVADATSAAIEEGWDHPAADAVAELVDCVRQWASDACVADQELVERYIAALYDTAYHLGVAELVGEVLSDVDASKARGTAGAEPAAPAAAPQTALLPGGEQLEELEADWWSQGHADMLLDKRAPVATWEWREEPAYGKVA